MPLKQRPVGKLYWTIGEVADELRVNTSLLRYWEKEFGELKPRRGRKGDRLYTQNDIRKVRLIQHLLKDQGFTIQGAREQLRHTDNAEPTDDRSSELRERLERVRRELIELRDRAMSGH